MLLFDVVTANWKVQQNCSVSINSITGFLLLKDLWFHVGWRQCPAYVACTGGAWKLGALVDTAY